MKFFVDAYTLGSGRKVYANSGVLGMGLDGTVYEGSDGTPWVSEGGVAVEAEAVLTAEERAEVAAEMVGRWKKWGGL